MKKRITLLIVCLCFLLGKAYGESYVVGRPGSNIPNAIVVPNITYTYPFSYSDKKDISPYTNTWGTAHRDIFYKIVLTQKTSLIVWNYRDTSAASTKMSLLNSQGNTLQLTKSLFDPNLDATGLVKDTWEATLNAGIYYIVSEMLETTGYLTTNFFIRAYKNENGDTFNNPIVVSDITLPFQRTIGEGINQIQFYKIVFYKIEVPKRSTIEISNRGSSTYPSLLMHLLNSEGDSVPLTVFGEWSRSNYTRNEWTAELPAGTYYVVSQGYFLSGTLVTNITLVETGDDIILHYDTGGNRVSIGGS